MKDPLLLAGIGFLILFSLLILRSIAPFLFPYYFIFIFLALVAFFVFSQIDFDIWLLFSKHLFVLSIIFLVLPIIIGQVTRGTIRWLSFGALNVQPAEIVRPFILLFFAKYLYEKELTVRRILTTFVLLIIPLFLILIQPSLGVTVLTAAGFLGVLLASDVDKKKIGIFFLGVLLLLPVGWFVLAPYQKARIGIFLSPQKDPYGAGYNSLQSMIAVGAGKWTGRGLGQGVQTQLAFLPERHTDFIFASIAEELGFVGAVLILAGVFFVLWRITKTIDNAQGAEARAFASGIFLTLFLQTLIHVGMNMAIFPITGVPLPLVSAGGSSLVATMISLGMVRSARKNS